MNALNPLARPSRRLLPLAALAATATTAAACSTEVPVHVTVQNVQVVFSLDNAVDRVLRPKLAAANCDVQACDRDFDFPFSSSGGRAHFSDDPAVESANKAVDRVEVDDILFDVKSNSLTLDLPSAEVWISYLDCEGGPCAGPPSPEDIRTQTAAKASAGTGCNSGEATEACAARLYEEELADIWKKVGTLPPIGKMVTGEQPFEFSEGGRDALNAEIRDVDFSYALRATLNYNPARDSMTPGGSATIELKMPLTIYLDPL